MDEKRRRMWVVGALAAVGAPLVVAATAFACANLSTIKLGKASGAPGTVVSVKGFNFSTRADSSAVAIRLNSRRGAVLAEKRADSRGRIQMEFRVPNGARVGNGVILATQTKANGQPVAGTPARHPFRVRGGSSSGAVPVAWSSPQQGPPPAAAPIPVVPIAGAALALVALSGGGFALARVSRRSAGMRAARSLSS